MPKRKEKVALKFCVNCKHFRIVKPYAARRDAYQTEVQRDLVVVRRCVRPRVNLITGETKTPSVHLVEERYERLLGPDTGNRQLPAGEHCGIEGKFYQKRAK